MREVLVEGHPEDRPLGLTEQFEFRVEDHPVRHAFDVVGSVDILT